MPAHGAPTRAPKRAPARARTHTCMHVCTRHLSEGTKRALGFDGLLGASTAGRRRASRVPRERLPCLCAGSQTPSCLRAQSPDDKVR